MNAYAELDVAKARRDVLSKIHGVNVNAFAGVQRDTARAKAQASLILFLTEGRKWERKSIEIYLDRKLE
jgi:hypothetical protein